KKNLSFKVINTIRNQNEIILDKSEEIKNHNETICRKLLDHEDYMSRVNKLCMELWPFYERNLIEALNSERTTFTLKNLIRFFLYIIKRRKPEYRYILNYFRCESSRFVIVRSI